MDIAEAQGAYLESLLAEGGSARALSACCRDLILFDGFGEEWRHRSAPKKR
jgi:hypothetical protein